MIGVLLATTLSCSEGAWILEGVYKTPMTEAEQAELAIEIIAAMPDNCTRQQYRGVIQ